MRSILLNIQSFPLERFEGSEQGYYNEDGDYIEGVDTTAPKEEIRGSLQPVIGKDLQKLDSGFKTTDIRKIYTRTKLKNVDEDGHEHADFLIIEGKRYQVQRVEPWNAGIRLNHYEVLLLKEEK